MKTHQLHTADRIANTNALLQQLKGISLQGLSKMIDPEKQLFCLKVRKNGNGVLREGHSLRYTIISLIGLYRAEARGEKIHFDIQGQLKTLCANIGRIDNIGDMGLLLWLCALAQPSMIDALLSHINRNDLLLNFSDAREGKTTELAWLLTGLSYAAMAPASASDSSSIERLARSIYESVKKNYGGKGIFGHQSKNTLEGKLRGRIGSFADQVYPIYGLSKFSKAYDNPEALNIALDCANTLCRHQGAFGQWWWHYDANTGKVLGRYPVYSVHQHSMAPMALFALEEASGRNYHPYIYKGLEWITGKNELGVNMIDDKNNVIWRSFYRPAYKMRLEEFSSLARSPQDNKKCSDLIILYESRPYCLGWLLYAFADKTERGENI